MRVQRREIVMQTILGGLCIKFLTLTGEGGQGGELVPRLGRPECVLDGRAGIIEGAEVKVEKRGHR